MIELVEELPDVIAKISEALWGSLADHVTVHAEDNIVFTMTSGKETKV